jgi:rhamnogalacturonyl hydrolase YesR
MKITTIRHILSRRMAKLSLKENYWAVVEIWARLGNLWGDPAANFRSLVIKDQFNYLTNSTTPITGECRDRAELALQWLLNAQKTTSDNGVSLGYFLNNNSQMEWRESYPETTGYIIQSLVDHNQQYSSKESLAQAITMAEWESEVQMASGAVQGGPLCSAELQQPAIFNTGMVLQGYSALLEQTKNEKVHNAARLGANFLLEDLGEDGHFKTHGAFVSSAKIKTYNVLCAWALYRFGELLADKKYIQAAVKSAEAAMGQQAENGWFANNDLSNPEAPLTHTIGYTLQGLLEVGTLSKREDMIEAVRRGVDPIIPHISNKGFLAGRFFSDWQPASLSSCLTGSAQLAVIYLRLYEITGEKKYQEAGNRLLNYLKTLQQTINPDPNLIGALAGSQPIILGGYMRAGYPNWATKYLLDGLMLQDRLESDNLS